MSKKTFKNELNPALQFINTSANEENQEQESQNITYTVVPMKRNPLYIETKSKRIQLLIQPSLHSKLKEICEKEETSLNDLIHTILEKSIQKNK